MKELRFIPTIPALAEAARSIRSVAERLDMAKKTDKKPETVHRSARPKIKPTAAFYGLICMILGIIDLVNPERMLNIIAYALGISAIVGGLIFVIMYLARDVRHNLGNNDFLNGVVSIVVGIVILLKWKELMTIVPIVLGVLIIVSGCISFRFPSILKSSDIRCLP